MTNRITKELIEAAIVRSDFFTVAQGLAGAIADNPALRAMPPVPLRLTEVTICALTLQNGHVSVGVNYGPVDPIDFREDMARKLAYEHAFDQLWPLFGFALREERAGEPALPRQAAVVGFLGR